MQNGAYHPTQYLYRKHLLLSTTSEKTLAKEVYSDLTWRRQCIDLALFFSCSSKTTHSLPANNLFRCCDICSTCVFIIEDLYTIFQVFTLSFEFLIFTISFVIPISFDSFWIIFISHSTIRLSVFGFCLLNNLLS
jgi:hypothetical protein